MASETPPIPLAPPSTDEHIEVRGAREHNLKNLSIDIPRDRFVVITGVSGSGKSTLAFDLLFAEGQRRFLDSLSVYARQFVQQRQRPEVDRITGLPPTVSIEQSTSRGGGKSTVATVTEIHHFIRLLWARIGTPYCPQCQVPVRAQEPGPMLETLVEEARQRGPLRLLAPIVRHRKGTHIEIFAGFERNGFLEMRVDGTLHATTDRPKLDRYREHDIDLVVAWVDPDGAVRSGRKVPEASARPGKGAGRGTVRTRSKASPLTGEGMALSPTAAFDEAIELGSGLLYAVDAEGRTTPHSTRRNCASCGTSFPPLDPKHFSYNSSQGWCPVCRGFGELFDLPDVDRGANADAVEDSWWQWASHREVCPSCSGARLHPEARAVRLECRKASPPAPTLVDVGNMNVEQALSWCRSLSFAGRDAEVARDILPEIQERLRFLVEVGLGYLQLGRSVTTLSGGESQRIRLAAQLGSNLSGVLYVLDEPSIGLHCRDNDQLLHSLQQLRARGNSLVVVEHDEDTMRQADHIIDLGPGAGVLGGTVVAAGSLADLMAHPDSITGQCLRSRPTFPTRGGRRPVPSQPELPALSPQPTAGLTDTHPPVEIRRRGRTAKSRSATGSARDVTDTSILPPPRVEASSLVLTGAHVHNLKDLTVSFPLQRFIAVTGVSGSGKSTLIRECLLPAVRHALAHPADPPPPAGPHIVGPCPFHAVHEVDQSPIGRTPRSTPATYVGLFDEIRKLFSSAPEARLRGYGVGRFSFNSPAGRCPECQGTGWIRMEMNFLPTAQVRCETCLGRRFNPETLEVVWQGRSIADVLELSVAEALEAFRNHARLLRPLQALHDTGLDYLRLGQISPTLSGGEAQRIKLVSHLLSGLRPGTDVRLRSATPRPALFLLEEPTIGLHTQDVRRLVEVLQRLVDAGHSVIVIEHNLDLIAEADWVIDLGPEAGADGGRIVACGTPEQVAEHAGSHTGRYLSTFLGR